MASLTDNPVNMPLGVFLPALNIFHFALRICYSIFKYLDILKKTLHLSRMKMYDGGQYTMVNKTVLARSSSSLVARPHPMKTVT